MPFSDQDPELKEMLTRLNHPDLGYEEGHELMLAVADRFTNMHGLAATAVRLVATGGVAQRLLTPKRHRRLAVEVAARLLSSEGNYFAGLTLMADWPSDQADDARFEAFQRHAKPRSLRAESLLNAITDPNRRAKALRLRLQREAEEGDRASVAHVRKLRAKPANRPSWLTVVS